MTETDEANDQLAILTKSMQAMTKSMNTIQAGMAKAKPSAIAEEYYDCPDEYPHYGPGQINSATVTHCSRCNDLLGAHSIPGVC